MTRDLSADNTAGPDPLRVVIAGAGGRMGQTLLRAALNDPAIALHRGLDRPGSSAIGVDCGLLAGLPLTGVTVTDDLDNALDGAEAVIDFTVPDATATMAHRAAKAGIIHIIGTTGLGDSHRAAIATAAARIAVVQSGNMSLGVNLLASLVRRAAASLGPEWDIEVLEMHHRAKIDAPSGTALLLGEAAARGRDIALDSHAVRVRDGHTGPRPEGAIGFATLRGGSVVGEHDVILATAGERIVLSHKAEDRSLFARGALTAALWARGQPAGLYSMAHVLGLDD